MTDDRWTGEVFLTDTGGLFGRITDAFGQVTELHGTREIGSASNDWRPGWVVVAHLASVPQELAIPLLDDAVVETDPARGERGKPVHNKGNPP